MNKPLSIWIALFSLSALYCADTVYASVAPEKTSVRIASKLRAYSDKDWASLAGVKSSERYEIARGDTLWDISARLFGEAKVWPKIWEINNTEVSNPHMIEPKMTLVFNSGSGLSLPSLALKSSGTMTVTNHYTVSGDDRPGPVWDERTPMPSREWKNLARQSWENVRADLPPNIDKDGFDSKNRVYLTKPATGLDLPHLVECSKIQPLATVMGTRSLSNYVYRGSEVTIQSAGAPLEVGKVYTLVDPDPLTVESGNRQAFSYALLGKVKILGLQSGTYVAEILSIKGPVARGSILIPEVARIEKLAPVAATSQVKGTLIGDHRTGAFMTGQNKWVYIDRGTKDGVDRGMIFRIFQNQDPKNGKRLTPGDVFVQGDVQILQGCADFSVGMFVWSRGEVPERYEGNLLSDVTDEKVRFYFNGAASELETGEIPALQAPAGVIDHSNSGQKEAIVGPSENPDLLTQPPEKPPGEADDWLDKLDNHQELKTEEENELQQLEKFKENQAVQEAVPPADTPPPPPSSDFSAEEPVATAPKATAPPPEPAPADDASVEGLTPL